jgi:predicted nucleic acid-binding protein
VVFVITFDTGALIALQAKRQRMVKVFAVAREQHVPMFAPSVAVAEWWRKRSARAEELLAAMRVEQTDTLLVKLAGEAVAAVKGAGTIDAIVMASAARRGGVVYTSDLEDLLALRAFFPAVRVLHC